MSVSVDDESDRTEGVPHPRHATRLIGQGDPEQALIEALRAGRLPHAIILGGPAGIGKATLAWRIAKFLLAQPSKSTRAFQEATALDVPVGSRPVAQVESLSHPDVVLLRREVNEKSKRFYTEIRADDVRRAIGLFQRAAGAGGHRICIVDSAEDLNRSSANALLKIIEEPPPASLFILVAHRPGMVLPTIRSRSRLIRLDPLRPDDIVKIVDSLGPPWSEMGDEAIGSAAAQAQGSVHGALRQLVYHQAELSQSVDRLLGGLPALEWREVHKLADAVAGRDGEAAYETAMTSIFDWLAGRVRRDAASPPRCLAPLAEVWEKIAQSARETDALNLDKRPLILSIFSDLAAAVRAAAA